MSEVDELVKGFMDPHNVGRLIKALQGMDPDTPVFQVEIGNIQGSIKWKRKETWKQWVKKEKDSRDE